jgi:glutamate N-acetyltransferase / amino-acid N-acetyltransferase
MKDSSPCPLTPRGFSFAGIAAGIKGNDHKDLGLILTDRPAIAGGVFTRNRFPSAHVQYCRRLVPLERFRALIVNSGNANAATGQDGIEANRRMAAAVAERFGIESDQVLTASTGIIGRPFPLELIIGGLDRLAAQCTSNTTDLATAIMTTDTFPKQASTRFSIGPESYTVTGVAKGSGMIHPNMATMLAFVMTDAPIAAGDIQTLATAAADISFNCISVDGDTSTNDSFFLISTHPGTIDGSDVYTIGKAINTVAIDLARQIARDGEGAEHLIEVTVSGAADPTMARVVLNAILTSNLVKTAIHGRDPNWGRILAAVGNGLSGLTNGENFPISITIQGMPVFSAGEPVKVDSAELSHQLGQPDIDIRVDLHRGGHHLTGWGCDLSAEYVRINAEYST